MGIAMTYLLAYAFRCPVSNGMFRTGDYIFRQMPFTASTSMSILERASGQRYEI